MKNLKSFLTVLFVSTFLSACSSLDIRDTRPTDVKTIDKSDAQWQQHLKQIKQIQHYSNQGQIGYISNKERFSSRFEWNYNSATNYTLKLYSTVSSSSLLMQMHKTGMTISDNKGHQRSEADAKMLVREIVGMDVPLEQFAYWLKGQPDEKANYQVGENHYLASFTYPVDGTLWTADYLNYHADQTPALPKDILLKNDNQTLKIRVDNWKF
ncbi:MULTISPECIES: lipoprotein insertase outer membrane protein LolB [Pasteurellaceae]|uniref:Outer-membrane lipoprotein LolB n=1 Tax=Pasteurella bettyae CCUG 2042 TaxID=1095749 RepID=I3DCH1_9PAST|nr:MULTISPECIES: lipoprotein insertase outer membrane protein LolB [Pasteurellaceae]EIJ69414.1 outer membrane lipoprotein LolB [Pasteurella bettyae CCUG 2042]SUB21395.1 outer-membrane lipoprotein LolB [Pasteurella bettyae]